ncbi:MAG: SGNH/GDSL hydrolase family protein [Anaerolineae bacterium]|nr:SGNH/GDSL hydrolase family protein [Anaerolineae bacterium]
MPWRRRLYPLLLWLTWLCGCSRPSVVTTPTPTPPVAPEPTASGEPPLRLLFIGNSLTYANDLPTLVQQVAVAAGHPVPMVKMVAVGGYSLEDHWADGAARAALDQGGWDVVVLQQGPSALPESRRNLVTWTQQFDPAIRQIGGRTALYMVWPEGYRPAALRDVALSYASAAASVDGLLLPVGEGWRIAWQRDACLPLYGPDQFHPSLAGSWLAALIIYGEVYGEPVAEVRLPVTASALRLTPDQLTVLVEAATDGVQTARLSLEQRASLDYTIPRCPR